jgi:hypothetical protein
MCEKTIIVALGTLLLFSCSTAERLDEKTKTIQLDYRQNNKTVNLSDVVALEGYIPLSNEDDALVGEISKMIVTSEHFVIKDDLTSSILIFDKNNGSLIRKINAQGRGLGEYVNIEDITVDRQGNIYLLSKNKFIVFDKFGNFSSEARNPYIATNIAVLPNGYIVLSCENIINHVGKDTYQAGLLILNHEFEIEKTFFPFKESERYFAYDTFNPFILNGDDLIIHQRYDDNLYRMQEDGDVEVIYRLDYGNNNSKIADELKKELIGKENPKESLTRETQVGYCVLLGLFDLTDTIFLMFRCEDYYSYAFFNKHTGEVSQYSIRYSGQNIPIPLINDFDPAPYYAFYGADGDYLYSFAWPDNLMEGLDGTNELLNKIGKQLQPGGNLIITKFKLK